MSRRAHAQVRQLADTEVELARLADNARHESLTSTESSGTQGLMLAVLEEGIRSYLNGRGRIRDEAEYWIFSQGRRSLFAFAVVCEHLGLDPEATRSALARMSRQHTPDKPLTRSRPNVSRSRRVLR